RGFVARNLKSYYYLFNYQNVNYLNPPESIFHGPGHTMELPYLFGADRDRPWEYVRLQTQDISLIKAMMSYWSSFAWTGNPNYNGGVYWPQLNAGSNRYLNIDSTITTANADAQLVPQLMFDVANSNCSFWDSLNP